MELDCGESNPELNSFMGEYEKFLDANNVTDWNCVCKKMEERLETEEKLKEEVNKHMLIIGGPCGDIEVFFSSLLSTPLYSSLLL